jgi:diketogulonate reductase-like aldo/keto reductase
MRTVTLADAINVPVLGQGTWEMGRHWYRRSREIEALKTGIDLGMTCIDTAESYDDGGAERVVAEAIAGQRERVFVVTKVSADRATRATIPEACAGSLRRLRTEVIDLYLVHWRGDVPLAETVEAFEKLRAEGKIRHWGTSNFDVADLEELGSGRCAANQVLYHPEARGIEYDLLPWSQERRLPTMVYSPLGQAGRLLRHKTLRKIARRHDATSAQVALAWGVRQPWVISIPKASRPRHVRANHAALTLELTADDLREIDAALPPPNEKQKLVIW